MSFHRRNDDQHDALNDYLDALARSGSPQHDPTTLSPDMRETVDRFFSLADDAGMVSRRTTSTTSARRSSMNTLAAPVNTSAPAHAPWFNPRSWHRGFPALTTATLIVAVIALTFAAFGPNGLRNGNDGEPTNFALAPVATAAPDELSSTRPYPGANECTVEPMTREEIIDHLEQANVATYPRSRQYEQPIKPTTEERDAILQTYNSWRACGLNTPTTGPAYQLRFETPWMTATTLPVFSGFTFEKDQRPISESELTSYADILVGNDSLAIVDPEATPMYGTPAPSPNGTPEWVPLPAGATPIAQTGGRAFPTLFADDIVMTGPETAKAKIVFVNEKTNAVEPSSAYTARFALVDGHWLVDSYTEYGAG